MIYYVPLKNRAHRWPEPSPTCKPKINDSWIEISEHAIPFGFRWCWTCYPEMAVVNGGQNRNRVPGSKRGKGRKS